MTPSANSISVYVMSEEVSQPLTNQGAASKPASVLITLNIPSCIFPYVSEEHHRQSVGQPEGESTLAVAAMRVPDGPSAGASFFSTATLSLVTVCALVFSMVVPFAALAAGAAGAAAAGAAALAAGAAAAGAAAAGAAAGGDVAAEHHDAAAAASADGERAIRRRG